MFTHIVYIYHTETQREEYTKIERVRKTEKREREGGRGRERERERERENETLTMKPEAQPAAASSSVHLRTIVICIHNIMHILSAREKHTGSS